MELENVGSRSEAKAANISTNVAEGKAPLAVKAKQAPAKDTPMARAARFAAGSIFGIVFLVICFVMLTTALKGPDTVTMDGVTSPAGLFPFDTKPTGVRLVNGSPAPDFVLNQLGGSPVQLSKLRGKTVLVNFWASWCGPCKDEAPDMQKFYQLHRSDNFQLLAVNYREDGSTAKAFFKDNNLTMPVLLDSNGLVAGGYTIPQFPESYFVDKNGVIQEYAYGPLTLTEMETKLAHVWQVSGK